MSKTTSTRRRRGPRGRAYNEQVLNFTRLAKNGGPIRLSLGSVDRNSSRTGIYADAIAGGWTIYEGGGHLVIIKSCLPLRRVIGVSGTTFIYAA